MPPNLPPSRKTRTDRHNVREKLCTRYLIFFRYIKNENRGLRKQKLVKPCHFSWMVMKPQEGSEQQSLVRISMVTEELWGVAAETSKFRKRKINSGATISLHLDLFLDLCVYLCTVLLTTVGQPDLNVTLQASVCLNVTLHEASSESYHPATCPLDFHTLHLCLYKKRP